MKRMTRKQWIVAAAIVLAFAGSVWGGLIFPAGILLALFFMLFDDVLKSIVPSSTREDLAALSRGVSSVAGGVVLLVFGVALFVGGLAALLWLIKTLWFWV